MSAVTQIISVSFKERKTRIVEIREMRETRRVVLGKPIKPLRDIPVVNRRTVSAQITPAVTVQANSSRQQSLARVRARCVALGEENRVREAVKEAKQKKKKDEEDVRTDFKKLAEEKMKVVTPEETRMTSIPRHRDIKPVKGCLKQVKANPYGTVSLDLDVDVIRSGLRGSD